MRCALVLAVAAIDVAACPAPAFAWHEGAFFDKSPGAGGGGGITYVGAPNERGWTCAMCHVDAPGALGVAIASDPPSLIDSASYEPGRAYLLTARLLGEHEGLDVPTANYNSIAIRIVDATGSPAGTLSDYAPEVLYAHDAASVISAGVQTGATSWTLSWRAPEQASGPLTIHFAAVDGNGAGGQGGGLLTDPFGDDLYVGAIALDVAQRSGHRGQPGALFAVAVVGALWGGRRVRKAVRR